MGRSIVSVVLGFLAGAIVVGLLEAAGHLMYPPPPDINLHNPEQLKAIIEKLPVGALIMVLVAWAGGSFAAGLIAALVAKNRKPTHALIVGCLQMLAGGITMLMIPHPTWFIVMSFLIVVPSAWIGAMFAGFMQQSPPAAGPQPYDMREKNMAC